MTDHKQDKPQSVDCRQVSRFCIPTPTER